jgi:hypothetical protein
MEAVQTSETSVNFYQTTRRCNPEDSHIHTHRRENLKSYYERLLCFVASQFENFPARLTLVKTHNEDQYSGTEIKVSVTKLMNYVSREKTANCVRKSQQTFMNPAFQPDDETNNRLPNMQLVYDQE